MKVTLRDVARAAGVSLTAASMAMGDTGRLSEDTRTRVRRAARDLGYRPPAGRSPRAADCPTVGILMNIDAEWAFVYHFIRPIIEEIGSTLAAQESTTVLIPISARDGSDAIFAKIVKARIVAVAALHYGNEQLFERLENAGIPVVLIMNNNFQDRFYSVCVDDFQGAYEGTCRLIRRGHRNLGYIECVRRDLPQLLVDRFFGFRKAVEEYGLDFDDSKKLHVEPEDMHDLASRLGRTLSAHPDMSALFVLDDELALHVLGALALLGRSVPGHLSLIAPGDVLDYDQPHIPRLSTMRIDTAYMGRIAAQMLLNRMQHNPQELHVLKVKQQLVKRGSVATGPAGLAEGEEAEKFPTGHPVFPVERRPLRP